MRVRVWILCNASAGRSISDDDLRTLVESAGHTVVDLVSPGKKDARVNVETTDLVVAAGGDGTVASAAASVAGTPIPLAILPLGTANNIAASVGLSGEMTELITSWHRARRVPFDLGRARAGSQTWLVVEGVGCGLIPSGIAAAERRHDSEAETAHPVDEVATAVQTFYDVLSKLEPVRQTLVLDGNPVSEDLLLFEILNIRSIGPNLVLSADASPSDGLFDVVLAGPSHRAALLTYLESLIDGRPAHLSLPTRRARSVQIEGCSHMHVDDERLDMHRFGTVSVDISPAALSVLV